MARIGNIARRARGSSLATVILVILVLTVVGIGIAYFTQVEDRLSGNTRMQRAGFYAADAGLRKGEAVIGAIYQNTPPGQVTLDGALGWANPKITIPGGLPGDYQAVVLHAVDPETSAVQDYLNIDITPPALEKVVDTARYSLYIRNNVEDVLGTEIADKDGIINLVSVGEISLPGLAGRVTTILEEQLRSAPSGAPAAGQKNVDASSTNTLVKGKS